MQTYEQLKEENAKAEVEATKQAAKLKLVEDADEAEDPKPKETPDTSGTEGEGDSDSDDWLAEPKEGEASEQKVSVDVLIGTRKKLQGKVQKITAEKNGEIEELKKEIENLKQAKAPAQTVEQVAKLPDPLEFDTTEQYQTAMSQFIASQVQTHLSLVKQTDSAKSRQETEAKAIDDAVEAHYKRAEDFLKQNSISEERYRKADLTVRQAVDSVFAGKGDLITDAIIAKAGEGTEVAMMFLGVNEEARALFVNKLMTDSTGLSAIAYLARLAEQKSKARANSSSGAPAPAARVRGSNTGGAKVDGDALKKLYKAETKNGGYSQAAWDAKQRAKAAGVDTSTW